MQNVQHAKAQLSQFQNVNPESSTVSVILTCADKIILFTKKLSFDQLSDWSKCHHVTLIIIE